MTSFSRKRIAIFLTILVTPFTHGSNEFHQHELNARCESKIKDDQRYPNCMNLQPETILWCDKSNYTRILQPDEHETIEADIARNVEILLFNDSCLLGIHREELVEYRSIKHFDGSQNYITRLYRSAFSNNKILLEIDLSDNLIADIEEGSFEGLSQLLILDLSNNRLDEIAYETFGHLSSLEKISLAGNSLTALHDQPFRRMKALKTLDLTGNKIASIIYGFAGLQNLEHLFLDGNRLKDVTDRTFVGTQSLQTLSISNNKIEKWPTALGKLFVNLRVLNLSSNFIETFTFEHTAELKELRYLSLGNNSLRTIESNQFLSTENLKFLNLSGNYIEELSDDTFTPLEKLETLLLEDNMLKTPNKRWFEHLSKYNSSQVNIQGPHWECNCGIVEFKDFVDTLPQTLANQLQIRCSMPRFAEGYILDDEIVYKIRYRSPCGTTPLTTQILSTYAREKTKKPTIKPLTTTMTKETTRKRKVTPRIEAVYDLRTNEPTTGRPSPLPDAKSLHTAIIASLSSAIIIILAAVIICCKLKQGPFDRTKALSKSKRNESTEECLSEDISTAVPTDHITRESSAIREAISTGSTYEAHPVMTSSKTPYLRDSRSDGHSYMTIELSPDIQHHSSVQQRPSVPSNVQVKRAPEQYNTPTTTPKRLFSQHVKNHVASPNAIDSTEPSLKADIPRRGSADSFQSCKDFSNDFQRPNPSAMSELEHMAGMDSYGPPSSFQFYSIEDRKCGDGAEAQIST